MDAFGVLLAFVRGSHLAAVLSVFGVLVVSLFVEPVARAATPPAMCKLMSGRLRILLYSSLVAVGTTALAWSVCQAAEMSGAIDVAGALQALPATLTQTRYGWALLLRLGLLALVTMTVLRGQRRSARGWLCFLAGAALVVQSWMGHPAAAEDLLLLASSMAHILSAGAWIGGLAPLLVIVSTVGPVGAGRAAERFSWIGATAVTVLAGTAIVQGWKLIGDEGGWFGTPYGLMACAKVVLFVALLWFAAINRFLLTPSLLAGDARRAGRHLLTSIVGEVVLGLLVAFAAASMATLAPGAHEQPIWPFSLRPNMAILDEADVRMAFIEAGVFLMVAVGLAVRAILFRRGRVLIFLAAAAVVWQATTLVDEAPFLDPMFIEAHPTSYYVSPTGFSAQSVADGQKLFSANCVACHGVDGRGDGPAAAALPVKPANLTEEHVWSHSDGEMFWWLTGGIQTRTGDPLMPAFGAILSETDRWALIDYIRAHLAGTSMAHTGAWLHHVTPPTTEASCSGGRSVTLGDLRGRFVRIIAGPNGEQPPGGTSTIIVRIMRDKAEASDCTVVSADVWDAYAIIAGVSPDQLEGAEFLVDRNGWLRAFVRPADAPSWSRPEVLAALASDIDAHPIVAAKGAHHHH